MTERDILEKFDEFAVWYVYNFEMGSAPNSTQTYNKLFRLRKMFQEKRERNKKDPIFPLTPLKVMESQIIREASTLSSMVLDGKLDFNTLNRAKALKKLISFYQAEAEKRRM